MVAEDLAPGVEDTDRVAFRELRGRRSFADVRHEGHKASPLDRILGGTLEGGQLPERLRLIILPIGVQSFFSVTMSL